MIVTCCKSIPKRWIGFTILPWASFALNFAVVGAAFVFSIKKFVENPAAVTFVLSLPGFLAIVVAPLSSFISDRIWTRFGRRKPFVLVASLCMISGLVAMPLMPNFWALLAAFILYHLGEGLSSPRDPLKQEIVPPHERGRATGAMTWCQNLATVVFYSVMLGRFDEVTYFAGFPLEGESVIYWSAALLLAIMLLLVALGIKEVDQKSPLRGEKFSLRNFVGGLLDRELWPVYLLVFSYGLLNFFSGFGPFLSTLLYTDQWFYTKQEMGTNIAIGGVVNVFIIGLLTFFADRLPRMKAFRTFIILSLGCNVLYFCYVNFVLPDKRPTLIEIILFGEVLSILSILIGLVYVPLTYDYVRRNKMGTFAAGAQIATRATQLFTLNGVGLFVWAYAALFQPPAGEAVRVVLREPTEQTALIAALRAADWSYPQDATAAPAKAISASGWQADGVVSEVGRAWEIRLRNPASESLAKTKKPLEAARSRAQKLHGNDGQSAERLAAIDRELAQRAQKVRAQVTNALRSRLQIDGDEVLSARFQPALLLEVSVVDRPNPRVVEKILADLRRTDPYIIDLRPFKRESGYGLALSAVTDSPEADSLSNVSRASTLRADLVQSVNHFAPNLLESRTTSAATASATLQPSLTLDLQVLEEPVSTYVSPVTRVVNAVLRLFDRAPSPTRKLDAVARQLRIPGETNHVSVTVGPAARTIEVRAVFESDAARANSRSDAVGLRLATLLGSPADEAALEKARAFFNRIESAALGQRLTVPHPVLGAAYVPMRYDYMSGYIWVFFVGVVGITLTFIFSRLEARGKVRKRGVEEAQA